MIMNSCTHGIYNIWTKRRVNFSIIVSIFIQSSLLYLSFYGWSFYLDNSPKIFQYLNIILFIQLYCRLHRIVYQISNSNLRKPRSDILQCQAVFIRVKQKKLQTYRETEKTDRQKKLTGKKVLSNQLTWWISLHIE